VEGKKVTKGQVIKPNKMEENKVIKGQVIK
jgi:hypothetical protein